MRPLYPVTFVLIALTVCSCNPQMNLRLIASARDPLPDTTQCVIIWVNDNPAITGTLIGTISYLNYSRNSSNPYLEKQLMSAARRAGANLIDVGRYSTPAYHVSESLFAFLYKVDDIKRYKKKFY